jgi:hypothetical protein
MNASDALPEDVERGQALNLVEMMPAYALGAADAEEAAAILRAFAAQKEGTSSAQSKAELQAYQELAELLLYAPPRAAAPPGLALRLQAQLAAPALSPAPPRRAWNWPLVAAIAAAIAAAALLLFNLLAMREIDTLRMSQASLQQQVALQATHATQAAGASATRVVAQEAALAATLAVTLTAQQEQIATQDALLTQLVVGESERYTMTAVQPQSSAVANVAWLDDENVAVLRAEGFPPLEEGRAYQLWLIRGDTRTSGGLFTVDEYGCGTYVFHPTESLEAFDGMGITPEPAEGSPGPTAPPVVRAQL